MTGAGQASYRDTALWQALADMRIEREGASATFARRLGRKQGWGKRHTYAVIEEYRRFLYLAVTGDRPVTPSDDVDEAWHLHLTYTRHYWDELCGRILGKPLHHDPTEGGAAQQAHFQDQYRATLERYEAVFGEPPRPDIWRVPALSRKRRWTRLFG
ncbi:MAG: glycine-rich domain-containing protein [Allosphingosinicella sp.]|uniref:glycine-rich domain-containing protein n=1 Tax=Allosphingosinicella sp. TaxID=2823234 RepID=UPI0039217675